MLRRNEKGLGNVTQQDWQLLGQRILSYQNQPYNRSVILRYAPEMNGRVYHLSPFPLSNNDLLIL